MGIFDLFGKDPKTKNPRTERFNFNTGVSHNNETSAPVSVFSPTAYSDVETIIDALKAGKNAVVHLTELKTETAIRVLDMLSGAIYALGGGVYEMGKNIFMFSPAGVEVNV
ncbi:MAG: cell division protein SepF [Clostridia bacterium]|nr:cell division protein SepF [Clostridia bacterium]